MRLIPPWTKISEDHDRNSQLDESPTAYLCFFGQVKNINEQHLQNYVDQIVRPLQNAGFRVLSVLHTYNATSFQNRRNCPHECNDVEIDIENSIQALKRLFPLQLQLLSFPMEADVAMGSIEQYLTHGDPWPDNPRQSFQYFLRQQYSLEKVTQLLLQALTAEVRHKDDIAIFLRPDLSFPRPLSQHDLMCRISKHVIGVPDLTANLCNDRFAIGLVEDMVQYGMRRKSLLSYANKHKPHAEEFLFSYLKESGIRPFVLHNFAVQRVRANGEIHPGDEKLGSSLPKETPPHRLFFKSIGALSSNIHQSAHTWWRENISFSQNEECPQRLFQNDKKGFFCALTNSQKNSDFSCLLHLPPPSLSSVQTGRFYSRTYSAMYIPSRFEDDWIHAVESTPSSSESFPVCPLQADPRFSRFIRKWVEENERIWKGDSDVLPNAFYMNCDEARNWSKTRYGPHSVMILHRNSLFSTPLHGSSDCIALRLEPIAGLLRHPYSELACSDMVGSPRGISNYHYLSLPGGSHAGFRSMFPGRKIFFDLGSSMFYDASRAPFEDMGAPTKKWFQGSTWLDLFRRMDIEFDAYIGFEVQTQHGQLEKIRTEVSAWDARFTQRVCWVNRPCVTEMSSTDNPFALLAQIWRPGDYVVFKLDIDTPILEWDIVENFVLRCPDMIAEFFFEFHVPIEEIQKCCWKKKVSSSYLEALRLFRKLRRLGIIAHYWT